MKTPTSKREPFLTDCLLVGHQRKAALVFTIKEWFAICHHMLQGNDSFLIPYVDDETGKVRYARSKPLASGGKVRVEKQTQWAWDTSCGLSKYPGSIGFYAKTKRGDSKWAAFDVDAHDGDTERARAIAGKLFAVAMQHVQLFVILSTSGNGGWHLFLFSVEFRPCDEWTRLLRQIADMAGVQIAKGNVEIFPNDAGRIGKGIRAPGTWNPKTGRCGEIAFESITQSPLLLTAGSPKETTSLSTRGTTREEKTSSPSREKNSLSSPSREFLPLFRGKNDYWTTEFAITAPRQRHDQLMRLVGAAFWQCGREVAEENARLQFEEAQPRPASSLGEHLAEFAEAWEGMERQWLSSLAATEREVFDTLTTTNERSAFRIIKSWSRWEGNDPRNFYITVEALARRLGISVRGAGKLRRRFCQPLGILKKISDYIPQIDQMEPDTVLDLALTQIAQTRRPLSGMDQIIGHML
jgi:hypothetical protein